MSHDGTVQGKGKGTIISIGAQTIELTSQLADMHADWTRTYAQANFYNGTDFGQMQSGRRSDGGNSYANMQDKYATLVSGDAASYWAYVKVCQDVSLAPDWCSAQSNKKDL